LMRLAGSGAFGAAARSVYGVLADPQQDGQPVFLPIKVNLAPPLPGLIFSTTQVVLDTPDSKGRLIEASRIEWLPGVCMVDAEELMSRKRESAADENSAATHALQWLLEKLAAGSQPSQALREEVRDAGLGFSWPTVERAKQVNPQIKARKAGKTWEWYIEGTPSTPATPSPSEAAAVDGVAAPELSTQSSLPGDDVDGHDVHEGLANVKARVTLPAAPGVTLPHAEVP